MYITELEIEELKKNRAPYYLLTDREREIFEFVGSKEHLMYRIKTKTMFRACTDLNIGNWVSNDNSVFQIKNSYQLPKENIKGCENCSNNKGSSMYCTNCRDKSEFQPKEQKEEKEDTQIIFNILNNIEANFKELKEEIKRLRE